MDGEGGAGPHPEPTIKVGMAKPVHSYAGFVILELKFTNRFPNWFRELVRVADTMQCGAAKYVAGAGLLGHSRLSAHAAALEEENILANYVPIDDRPPAPVHAKVIDT